MGVDYENIDTCSYDNFIPFIFGNKTEENKTVLFNKPLEEEEYSKLRKISSSEKINESSTISHSRKSTLDIDEELDNVCVQRKNDKLDNIFKNPDNSGFFKSKKDIDIINDDKLYLNFNEKDDIRKRYYSKLIYKNLWSPGCKSKKHNSLFIFDWDDTLLPTSFILKENIMNEENLSEELRSLFSILEEKIINILNLSISKGNVYIITNSSLSWFIHSSEKFFPNLSSILNKIKIISARDEYENIYPRDSKIWKQKAFYNLESEIDNNLPTNMICFGDSSNELEAGKNFASHLRESFVKTIKFKEKPEIEDLIKQLNLIENKFDFIYSKAKNLSIVVEQKY
jgi:hypothetical protein